MDHMKAGGLAGLLGPPPKAPRGRKKIKAENPSGPLLVVPYPILADQGCVTVAPKEGKTYRLDYPFTTDVVLLFYGFYCTTAGGRFAFSADLTKPIQTFNNGLERINIII